MLVLTRKKDQKIKIGNVIITVKDIKPGQVRLGIEAPESVRVERLTANGDPERAETPA